MEDNRPIKPDPKYIEQYLHKINTVQTKPFLKKKSNPTLPCFAFKNTESHSQSKKQSGKTKAQIYEQIKRKNKEMFGQKKPGELQLQEKQKKIHPRKMTVDYKPKKTIQIEQYKKKDYVPNKNRQTLTQNKDRIEYEKLLDYFNKQLKSLEQEKKQFQQLAAKLKFKQAVHNQHPLLYSQVKSQVQKRMAKEKTFKCPNSHTQHLTKQQNKQTPPKFSKTYSVEEIKSKLQKTSQQMQLLKSELVSPSLSVKQYRYEIFQAHLLPTFEPQTIYDYIDPNKLKYNANKYYQSALKAFNCKFQKENKQCENVQEDQSCRFRPNIKEKFIGQKRVTKYDGWTEVWIPGKQRLMANKDNYKVIWLSNGDVIQDFSNGIKTYYSKAKDIYKIQYKDLPPIYYHQNTKQIWRYLQNGSREIIFANGRLQTIKKVQA